MADKKLYPKTALALLTALNLLNYIDRSVLFAVQDSIKAEFHRSDFQIGLLTAVFFIFYMIAAPFMGPLSVRFTRKYVIIVGALIWSVATLLTAITKNYDELLFRHTVVGVGEASFVVLSPTFIADMFPDRMRGRVMGIFYLAIPVGTGLGYMIGSLMEPKYGWRAPFYVGAAPGILLALLLLLIPEPELGRYDSADRSAPERDTLKGLVHNPAFLTATFGMAMMTFALGGLQVWMPTFLHRVHGYTLGQAGVLFGISTMIERLGCVGSGRMDLRPAAAAYEVGALSGVGGQPGTGHSRDVRGAVCQRQAHGRGNLSGGISSPAQHRAFECSGDQFGWTACARAGAVGEHFHLPHVRATYRRQL